MGWWHARRDDRSGFLGMMTPQQLLIGGAAVIAALAVMGLLPIPYMTHRGARRMQTYVKVLVAAFLVTPVLSIFVASDYTFDVLFVWTFGYAVLGWLPLHQDERAS